MRCRFGKYYNRKEVTNSENYKFYEKFALLVCSKRKKKKWKERWKRNGKKKKDRKKCVWYVIEKNERKKKVWYVIFFKKKICKIELLKYPYLKIVFL